MSIHEWRTQLAQVLALDPHAKLEQVGDKWCLVTEIKLVNYAAESLRFPADDQESAVREWWSAHVWEKPSRAALFYCDKYFRWYGSWNELSGESLQDVPMVNWPTVEKHLQEAKANAKAREDAMVATVARAEATIARWEQEARDKAKAEAGPQGPGIVGSVVRGGVVLIGSAIASALVFGWMRERREREK